jgi:antitoxin MazE
MQVQLSEWGDSLWLPLPRALAEQIGLNEGQTVNLVAEGARLVVEPVTPAYFLQDLLVNLTPDAMRAAFDWVENGGGEPSEE